MTVQRKPQIWVWLPVLVALFLLIVRQLLCGVAGMECPKSSPASHTRRGGHQISSYSLITVNMYGVLPHTAYHLDSAAMISIIHVFIPLGYSYVCTETELAKPPIPEVPGMNRGHEARRAAPGSRASLVINFLHNAFTQQ